MPHEDILHELRARLPAMDLCDFPVVRELRYQDSEEEGASVRTLDLVMESENRRPNHRLWLRFDGVSDLRLERFGGGQTRIIGLALDDIGDRGWESIAWEVSDYENGMLRFYAANATLVRITEL